MSKRRAHRATTFVSEMTRGLRKRTLLVLVAAGLAVLAPAAATPAPPPLVVAVADRSISLRTSSGQPVAQLAAGEYSISVRDRSRRQNVHLVGPGGYSRRTTARYVGTTAWRVTLAKGQYRVYSDAAKRSLRASFTVV